MIPPEIVGRHPFSDTGLWPSTPKRNLGLDRNNALQIIEINTGLFVHPEYGSNHGARQSRATWGVKVNMMMMIIIIIFHVGVRAGGGSVSFTNFAIAWRQLRWLMLLFHSIRRKSSSCTTCNCSHEQPWAMNYEMSCATVRLTAQNIMFRAVVYYGIVDNFIPSTVLMHTESPATDMNDLRIKPRIWNTTCRTCILHICRIHICWTWRKGRHLHPIWSFILRTQRMLLVCIILRPTQMSSWVASAWRAVNFTL